MLKDKPLAEATGVMLGVLDGLGGAPITEAEVDRARNKFLKFFEQTYNNSDRVGLGLSEYIAKGDWRLLFLSRDAMEKVTAADVNRVASAYFKPANRTTGLFLPEAAPDRAAIPAAPDPEQLLQGYKGKRRAEAGRGFDPSPGEHRRAHAQRGAAGRRALQLPGQVDPRRRGGGDADAAHRQRGGAAGTRRRAGAS